jgi:hypothetical protein
MEIETRSFRMQNKSFVLSQRYAVTTSRGPEATEPALPVPDLKNQFLKTFYDHIIRKSG